MESPTRDDKRGIVSEDVAADEFSDLYTAVNDFEKASIEKALNRHQWHRGRTASSLRLNRKTLFTKMKKYGLI